MGRLENSHTFHLFFSQSPSHQLHAAEPPSPNINNNNMHSHTIRTHSLCSIMDAWSDHTHSSNSTHSRTRQTRSKARKVCRQSLTHTPNRDTNTKIISAKNAQPHTLNTYSRLSDTPSQSSISNMQISHTHSYTHTHTAPTQTEDELSPASSCKQFGHNSRGKTNFFIFNLFFSPLFLSSLMFSLIFSFLSLLVRSPLLSSPHSDATSVLSFLVCLYFGSQLKKECDASGLTCLLPASSLVELHYREGLGSGRELNIIELGESWLYVHCYKVSTDGFFSFFFLHFPVFFLSAASFWKAESTLPTPAPSQNPQLNSEQDSTSSSQSQTM